LRVFRTLFVPRIAAVSVSIKRGIYIYPCGLVSL
jgi:hypothetical protein